MGRNEITGDLLSNNKGDQKKYEEGWENIFSDPKNGKREGFTHGRNFPIMIIAPDGRRAYIELVDGKLIHGGDLPTDVAAKQFFEYVGQYYVGEQHGKQPAIESPCIGVCQYPNGVCSGCGRTVEEVQDWHRFSEQEKKDTLLRIERISNVRIVKTFTLFWEFCFWTSVTIGFLCFLFWNISI